MKGFTKDGKFRPTGSSSGLTSSQVGVDDELRAISKMRGFFRYQTGSYWNGITQEQRNTVADRAIGDKISLKKYKRLVHSKFELIDSTNQKRLMNQFKKIHGF